MDDRSGDTGVMQLNGVWITGVAYEAQAQNGRVQTVQLSFMQDRQVIERLSVSREEALELLGARNLSTIERQAGQLKAEEDRAQGELRGATLAYRETVLPGNTLEAGRLHEAQREAAAAEPLLPGLDDADVRARRRENNRLRVDRANEEDKGRRSGNSELARDPRAVPADIAAKYLREGNRYYFDSKTLAFVDAGSKLRAETENLSVIADLVAIAKERQWASVQVRGSERFRREVWKAAYVQGIAVTGYRPSVLEAQQAAAAQRKRIGPNEVASMTRDALQDRSPRSSALEPRTERVNTNPAVAPVYGQLLAHGAAPYKFDNENTANYYARVKLDNGQELELWGKGLPDALQDSKTAVAIGDRVGLRVVGSKPVTVPEMMRGEHGERVVQEKATHRNDWVVEKPDYFQEPARMAQDLEARRERQDARAQAQRSAGKGLGASVDAVVDQQRERAQARLDAVRSAAVTREELQRNYPELGAAVFSELAAQEAFAQAFAKSLSDMKRGSDSSSLISAEDRQQIIHVMNERMRARLGEQLERGERHSVVDPQARDRLVRQAVDRSMDEVGRKPAGDRVADQVRVPKPLVREDVHVRA